MKKLTLIALVMASFFLSNCKKNASTETTATAQDEKAALMTEAASPKVLLMLQSIKDLANQDLKRLAYQTLTNRERYFVWLDNVKNAAKYDANQQVLITELINYLTPELLNSVPTAADETFKSQWLAKAKLAFSYNQIRAIAYQLYPENDHVVVNDAHLTTNLVDDGSDQTNLPNCNCNSGSDYTCTSTSVCPVDYFHGDCKNPTVHGCGFLYWYACDNTCYVPGSDPRLKQE